MNIIWITFEYYHIKWALDFWYCNGKKKKKNENHEVVNEKHDCCKMTSEDIKCWLILVGFFFWRDSVVYGFNSPLTSLKELLFGSWLPNSSFKKKPDFRLLWHKCNSNFSQVSSAFSQWLQLGNSGWKYLLNQ